VRLHFKSGRETPGAERRAALWAARESWISLFGSLGWYGDGAAGRRGDWKFWTARLEFSG